MSTNTAVIIFETCDNDKKFYLEIRCQYGDRVYEVILKNKLNEHCDKCEIAKDSNVFLFELELKRADIHSIKKTSSQVIQEVLDKHSNRKWAYVCMIDAE